ncbi:MAG: flavin reductase family protein, partial [Chloroflexaceae bacterium]|nr:flavin reductase family protein [Chloroflexaceae bacterium]
MSIDQTLFRQVMGHFASGVTVVTTVYEGQLSGITVSSFTSLSLNPMLVLICIDKNTSSHDAFARAGKFAVNILSEGQEYLSRRFATREINKFDAGGFTLSPHGLPLLDGALAHVEC